MPGDEIGRDHEDSDVTRHIADFVCGLRFEEIPKPVLERGEIHILDSLGLALAGARSPICQTLRAHLTASGIVGGPATIFGTAERAAPRFAAQANATAIHVDNFDDTSPQASPERNGGIHATAPVLAASLAVAEASGACGREFLTAFHAGVEVANRLNHAIAARHYVGGFHSTGTLGIFGAAVAAGRLLGLNPTGVAHAIAGAASRSSGIRRNFGSMVEPLHAGCAAEGGVAAADLAARGLEGAESILEGPVGYFEAAGGGYEPDAVIGRLGAPWSFVDPGTWIKPYPSGSLTHPAMACLTDLMATHGIAAEMVETVNVSTNARVLNTLIHHCPTTALQAKFSMEFGLAILLLDGQAGLGEFTDQVVQRTDVQEMMKRIRYAAYERAGPDYTNVTTTLEIQLSDGRTVEGRADFAKGSARDPMALADVSEKFRQCAAYAEWPENKARHIIDLVMGLADATSTVGLAASLAA